MPGVAPLDRDRTIVSPFLMQFEVDTLGTVDTATVRVDPRIAPPFPAALRRAALGWRYRPAVLRGCPVPFVVVDTMRITPVIGPADR